MPVIPQKIQLPLTFAYTTFLLFKSNILNAVGFLQYPTKIPGDAVYSNFCLFCYGIKNKTLHPKIIYIIIVYSIISKFF